jgi:hypothetical protein
VIGGRLRSHHTTMFRAPEEASFRASSSSPCLMQSPRAAAEEAGSIRCARRPRDRAAALPPSIRAEPSHSGACRAGRRARIQHRSCAAEPARLIAVEGEPEYVGLQLGRHRGDACRISASRHRATSSHSPQRHARRCQHLVLDGEGTSSHACTASGRLTDAPCTGKARVPAGRGECCDSESMGHPLIGEDPGRPLREAMTFVEISRSEFGRCGRHSAAPRASRDRSASSSEATHARALAAAARFSVRREVRPEP